MKPHALNTYAARNIMGWRSMGSHWADGPEFSDRTHHKRVWNPCKNPKHLIKVLSKLNSLAIYMNPWNDFCSADAILGDVTRTEVGAFTKLWETILRACVLAHREVTKCE